MFNITNVPDNISPDRPDLFAAMYRNAAINCIILMDEHGHIHLVNDAFTKAFGYTGADVTGRHIRVLFTEHDRKALRPEMELEMVKKQGFATDQNYTVHKNGQLIWASGESIWVESEEYGNCIVKVIQNIHTQKLQEHFVAEANELAQTIFESIEDALLVVSMDLRILKANAASYRMFDVMVPPPGSHSLTDSFQSSLAALKINEKLLHLDEKGYLQEDIEWTIPGGNTRTLRLLIKFLDGDAEKEKKALLVFHDITQEKQGTQQREDLIHFVSHELRNPLANLALVIELLPDAIGQPGNEATDYLQKAKANIRRLKQVLGELHDASRAATGHFSIKMDSFKIQDMITEAIESVRMLYPSHQIISPPAANRSIMADRFRLVQVLNNYLTNAIKYAPGAEKIIVDASINNDTLTVSVTDYGPGIPADQLQYVFNKYYRGRSTTRIDGLGLGLYVCREIIASHGGKVWATSQEGKGSIFFFSIPI